jgi:hypothetical protein
MSGIEIATFVVSLGGLLLGFSALRRAARAEAALASEKVERLSASQQADSAARLAAGRIDAIEQRVGRGRRLTPAKRERALALLAAGASELAVARELELREAEVAVLVRLRARIGIGAGA